ncbi:MAG TPA: FAD-dependent oxidoreductase, partial [Steroidobacteraceae bacterium]|nr:FAD-dependent oxidoreductase [Steroidobacteraceae bacterium]
MSSEAPIVIVGAGQAGVQLAESLRQEGYPGGLLLIGEERHPPYQRPPLSKKWLFEAGPISSLALRGAEALARRRIELKLAARVVAVHRDAQTVEFADGGRLP